MFEKLIIKLIQLLNFITREIERAYYETYGDKELAQEFSYEIEMRKQKNKDFFIFNAAKYISKQIYEKDNYLIPESMAMQMGEIIFESAKQEGLIDILNNSIEQK